MRMFFNLQINFHSNSLNSVLYIKPMDCKYIRKFVELVRSNFVCELRNCLLSPRYLAALRANEVYS